MQPKSNWSEPNIKGEIFLVNNKDIEDGSKVYK